MIASPTRPDIVLIFPPGWTPFSPYLALPSLKGYLEERGIPTQILDLNLEFFDAILSLPWLEKALDRCSTFFSLYEKKPHLNNKEFEHYREVSRALLLKEDILLINLAKQIFRSIDFYDPSQYQRAKATIFHCLQIASASFINTNIQFQEISYKQDVTDTRQISSILSNTEVNPFIQFYQDGILTQLTNSQIEVIGISVTSASQLIPALTLTKLIKECCPQVKHITLGGNYITRIASHWSEPHQLMSELDSIILYEGEAALHALFEAVQGILDFSDVPNLLYIREGILAKNKSETVPQESLAIPNFDGFPLDRYFMPNLILPIYSSRSCFGKCTFCTIPYASHGNYRVLRTEQIYQTMNKLRGKYGTRYFDFIDETCAPQVMHKLAKIISENEDDFLWYAETRFTPQFTQEFCQNLYKGGCRKLQFGLESYNQRILDLMKKEILIEWIEPTLENCMRAGITVHLFFMVGFPTETRQEALRTIKFTEDIIKKAREDFGNPYWTRGWGKFGLDKYSHVFYSPSTYNIVITDKAVGTDPNYIKLKHLEFISLEGMSRREVQRLVQAFKNDVASHLREEGYFSFHVHNLNLNSEEESFLRICCDKDPERTHTSAWPVATLKSLLITHSVLERQDQASPHWIHYNPETQFVWETEIDFSNIENNISQIRGKWVLLDSSDNEYFYAYNINSGRRILLNRVSHAFIKEFWNHPTTAAALGSFRKQFPRATLDQIKSLIILGVNTGILSNAEAPHKSAIRKVKSI